MARHTTQRPIGRFIYTNLSPDRRRLNIAKALGEGHQFQRILFRPRLPDRSCENEYMGARETPFIGRANLCVIVIATETCFEKALCAGTR